MNMSVVELLIAPYIHYWFIVLPELLYLLFFGFRFFGPFAILAWPFYSAALIAFPVPVMTAVGAVMAVHGVLIAAKSFIGDRVAGSKRAEVDQGSNGVPRMSGPDKAIQDDLDRMKQPQGLHGPGKPRDPDGPGMPQGTHGSGMPQEPDGPGMPRGPAEKNNSNL